MNEMNEMNEIRKRDMVAKWTSLWIFVPIVKKIFTRDINIDILDILVFCSGIASFNHWSHNINGGWRHMADILFASATIIYSILSNKLPYCMTIPLILIAVFFVGQRIIQYNKNVKWFNVMIIHSLFRFSAFWFVMNIYFPYLCSTGLSIYMTLSFIYVIHVIVIYKNFI